MSKQLDPLGTTAPELHRFWFVISTEQQWYGIMQECRAWFGGNWQSMAKVRRKLDTRHTRRTRAMPVPVWFAVPDPRFATWIAVKMSLQVLSDAKYTAGK